MAGKILVFVEVREGAVKPSSLEAVCQAKKLGAEVAALLVGEGGKNLADKPAQHGADKVYLLEDPRLNLYCPEGYAKAVAEAAGKFGAEAIFMGATAMGKDLAPSVAALFDTAAATDCVEIREEGGRLVFRRPVYAGKATVEVAFKKAPAVASLRPNVFGLEKPDESKKAQAEALAVDLKDDELKSRVTSVAQTSQGKTELTEAAVVVAAGRGFKGAEHLALRDKLAAVLKGAVGASRAIVDAGWCPHSEQVGQTGKTVSPNLYFAIGISGAIQHLAGMMSSKVIVAINKDPEAPIFKKATYGIVGDLFEVVPALTEELQKVIQA